MKWFVIRVVNGKEKKTKESIEFELNLKNINAQLLIPMEKSVVIRKGKKVNIEKSFMPGYIFIECESIKEMTSMIKHVNGVASVLDQPLTPREIDRFLIKKDNVEEENNEMFYVNQKIKIIDGPFDTFVGTIKSVNEKAQKLKLIISIFGTESDLELNFSQVVSQ